MPELPEKKVERFQKNYGLTLYDAEILTKDTETANYFEECVKVGTTHMITPKQIANVVINKKIDISSTLPAQLIAQLVSSKQVKTINEKELESVIKKVLTVHPKAVEDYKKGRENAIMFLVGQVMKELGEKIDANIVKEKIEQKIKEVK